MTSTLPIARILREEGKRAARRYRWRRIAMSCSGTVAKPLPIDRPRPVMVEAPPAATDRRPPARDKSPCPRCQTRGDLGCKHFAPCGKEFA